MKEADVNELRTLLMAKHEKIVGQNLMQIGTAQKRIDDGLIL